MSNQNCDLVSIDPHIKGWQTLSIDNNDYKVWHNGAMKDKRQVWYSENDRTDWLPFKIKTILGWHGKEN